MMSRDGLKAAAMGRVEQVQMQSVTHKLLILAAPLASRTSPAKPVPLIGSRGEVVTFDEGWGIFQGVWGG